jgi:hypothetical protein
MVDTAERLLALRKQADPGIAEAIEKFIRDAPDVRLNRINPLAFAAEFGFAETTCVAAFLHATQIGIFELDWNVVCGGCGGVLHSAASLKALKRSRYSCALCGVDCEPVLDDRVEVTFTVSRQIRRIAAHDPEDLALWDYVSQAYWSSGSDLPANLNSLVGQVALDAVEVPPGRHTLRSLQLTEGLVVVFDPVTHTSTLIEIAGAPAAHSQTLTIAIETDHQIAGSDRLAPGLLQLTLENPIRSGAQDHRRCSHGDLSFPGQGQ